MGMVQRQNEALTSKLVLGICAKAKRIWGSARVDAKQMEMEDAVCFMLIAFSVGLRGEEVPLVSLKGLLHFWEETWEAGEDKWYYDNSLWVVQGSGGLAVAHGPHQRQNSFQHSLLPLDGEDHGKEGQFPAPHQGLAI